ncbi:alpha/beta hydrolase [Streptomyces sp. So13.3]|uniref:alpha/beta hydrolase n=1 Tax=Streptomyces sp. So13.3 TaxID=2136173 RepID=UPI0011058151|nr:alpha/beta hydrolase [Streptomyces sp. So13.3]QNA73560.1 alpha/beta hydrolase [Streptomyces sp. So13.3]
MGFGLWLAVGSTTALVLVGGPAQPDLTRFYAQRITWAECAADGMQCGSIVVPLDYATPSRGTADIALTRYPATGPGDRIGSLSVNFGGPGVSGIDTLADRAGTDLAVLNTRYDLIGFDPRGVGRSVPVDCGDPPPAEGELIEQVRRLAGQCGQRSGRILPWIGTTNVSRDLDVMRAALGDEKLDYLGFSYGTKLGAVYAHQFPDRAGRLVLDGVEDPASDSERVALGQAAAFQRALEAFVKDCAKQGKACPIAGADQRARMAGLADLGDRLADDPVRTAVGDLGQDEYLEALQTAMYSADSWPALSEALAALRAGDGELMLLLAQDGGSDVRRRTRSDGSDPGRTNYAVAKLAVDCRDTSDRYTAGQVAAAGAAFAAASPVFGRAIINSMLACAGWPSAGDNTSRDVRAVDAPKALLVSTKGDPATPYANARRMSDALGNGSPVLTFNGQGHGAYFAHSTCVTDAVDGFLLDGRLPAAGTVCD